MRGDGPEVPGPRTLLYPRARRMRDIIDHHSRSAASVSLSTSTPAEALTEHLDSSNKALLQRPLEPGETTPTDPSPQRKGAPLPPPGDSHGTGFPSPSWRLWPSMSPSAFSRGFRAETPQNPPSER